MVVCIQLKACLHIDVSQKWKLYQTIVSNALYISCTTCVDRAIDPKVVGILTFQVNNWKITAGFIM